MFAYIEILLISVIGFFLLYLLMLSILAIKGRKKIPWVSTHHRRFAMIVPAYNEEVSIEKTLRSLFAVNYPKKYFDVVVVADNCSDKTAEISKKTGAIVFERTNISQRGKGYALRWCLNILLNEQPSYGAIVIVDADSIVSRNFVSVMNNYIARGSRAIQASDMVEPQPGVWSSEVTRLGFTLYNHVRPAGRRAMKCSAGVRGNGMCFSTELLREIPWNTFSLNEDLEYGLILLLNGITVDFAPEAVVHATMPTNAKNAESQRSRWERGRFPVIRTYGKRLLVNAIQNRSWKSFDAFVELITPPFVNLFSVVLLMLFLNGLLWTLGIHAYAVYFFIWSILVSIGMLHVLIGLYAARADTLLYKAFVYIPRYAIWKLLLYSNFFKRNSQNEWIRTTRDHVIKTSLNK